MTEHQIETSRKLNLPRSSYVKSDTIWCSSFEKWLRTMGRMLGRKDGRTDKRSDGRIKQRPYAHLSGSIKKKIIIYEEQAWRNTSKDGQAQGRTDLGINTAM